MKTIQFKVTLLSDIIISQDSGTKGNKQTIDFIPGSNFLGIVAKEYDSFGDSQISVFHSSKLKFGDAHPVLENTRALRKPASFLTPKNNKENPVTYVQHLISNLVSVKALQLKQSRNDFYVFVGNEAKEYKAALSFAIKSAYDRDKRRSKDEQMYGYQSMEQGCEYCFTLTVDDGVDSELIEKVKQTLLGKHTVGRSRTAQYGLIEIKEGSFKQSHSDFTTNGDIVIYAESRLIFNNEYGNLTYTPKAEDFGIKGGTIEWSKSQIRTFAYSPWNFKRSCFDTERKGIEKGSVIVISGGEIPAKSDFVGLYQNEGFGKVIVNPDFFVADSEGKSKLTFLEYDICEINKIAQPNKLINVGDIKLLDFLQKEKKREKEEKDVYKLVNEFSTKNKAIFSSDKFASQWGTIRSLAMQYPIKEDLEKELFTKKTFRNGKEIDNAYLTHGVAKEKWAERGRKEALQVFFREIPNHMIHFAIINLAAEMAKKSEGK